MFTKRSCNIQEMANLPTFLYVANSVAQASGDMIHYIAAARDSVYRCICLCVNQHSTCGVFCYRCPVADPSDHLTNRNLVLDDFVKNSTSP